MYSEEQRQQIFDDICDMIVNGKSLRTALKEYDQIKASDFFRWIRNDEEKRKQYARASEERAEFFREEIFDIADDGSNDFIQKYDKEGNPVGFVVDKEHIQRSKLRIDAREWYMTKINPKKYGDKIQPDTDVDKVIEIKEI